MKESTGHRWLPPQKTSIVESFRHGMTSWCIALPAGKLRPQGDYNGEIRDGKSGGCRKAFLDGCQDGVLGGCHRGISGEGRWRILAGRLKAIPGGCLRDASGGSQRGVLGGCWTDAQDGDQRDAQDVHQKASHGDVACPRHNQRILAGRMVLHSRCPVG